MLRHNLIEHSNSCIKTEHLSQSYRDEPTAAIVDSGSFKSKMFWC